ncbi:DUF3290 domain-containing protein [Volucribacter amazonae]|uniref:DUF3290 family protein n=1 Tax=Volucribacter amazonae TaxID=256731 RepID=A0A9X4PNQ8_9PAST|nr:DUF3290 domain-containing protein [Volucribacter amazonae]MDG6895133.1 hypothetical protein [Volucribacter amazonae]
MNFYTYLYLQSQTSFQGYIKYLIIFIALMIMLVANFLYLRHRMETKYRDLSIIFLLIVIFLLGVQYNYYSSNLSAAANSSRMITFLDSVIYTQQLEHKDILVNSRTPSNGMILSIKENYYEVHFNNDFSAYSLAPINLVNPHINIIQSTTEH